MLKKFGLALGLALLPLAAFGAAGIWTTFPTALLPLAGTETMPMDTNFASGAAPQTVQITTANLASYVRDTAASGSLVGLKSYTVATLPTCNASRAGRLAYVTDATAPTYNAALTGGGAVIVPVFCSGAAWTSH